MQVEQAKKLIETIPADAMVLDVGGGAAPFPRANWVIDALPFDKLGGGSHGNIDKVLAGVPRRFSAETWVSWDLCDRRPWPFADKQFDFVICSHLLEDIRDPIWVCSELNRVAKAGYIETPSRYLEQCRGVENPRHCGFYHHRWLVSASGDRLEFRMKPHCVHSFREAWVRQLSASQWIAPEYEVVAFPWTGSFEATEVLEFSEEAMIDELCRFAAATRAIPGLVVKQSMPAVGLLKKRLYWSRLALGLR